MRGREKFNIENRRYMSIDELREYTGLGESTAIKVGKKAAAVIKIGARTLYDRVKIDAYMDSISA